MTQLRRTQIVGLFFVFLSCAYGATRLNQYKLIKSYSLPGDGGWDSITLDAASHRLYLSHATQVQVVNADTGKLLGHIGNLQLAHGTVLIRHLNRGFISDGGSDAVVIFSLNTLKVIGRTKTGGNPDCIIYDPASHHIFTFNGRTQDSTVIDPDDGAVVATVPMGGRPEAAVADGRGNIYVNIRDTNTVAVLDSRKLIMKASWPVAPAGMATAIAMDQAHQVLFIGGRNKVFVIMDARTGKVLQVFPIRGGVDTNIYDPTRHLVFSSDRAGGIYIFREDPKLTFRVVQNVTTEPGAHTMAFDPRTNRIFLDTSKFDRGSMPQGTQKNTPNVFDHPVGGFHSMGVVRPGTFHLLVYGQ